jgi:precorrin-2 dehydrogenase/sirohydrochlorin ferrochelatase
MFYPVFLNLKGKRVVVIGGGEVAERRVESLLDTGASITVISPSVTPRLASLAESQLIGLQKRPYTQGDCSGAALVLSATDDSEASVAVWNEASGAGLLVNTADEPTLCDFIMPAVVRRGELTVAISTGGTSPALASRLRQEFSKMLGPEYSRLVELLGRARLEVRERFHNGRDRKALHYRILDSDIMACLKQDDGEGAERRLRQIIEEFAGERKTP